MDRWNKDYRDCGIADRLAAACEVGGADRDRTDDLLNAIQALSQLSYGPTRRAR